ncbi:hypothetical protein D3C72_1324970 [compost metagenome]
MDHLGKIIRWIKMFTDTIAANGYRTLRHHKLPEIAHSIFQGFILSNICYPFKSQYFWNLGISMLTGQFILVLDQGIQNLLMIELAC